MLKKFSENISEKSIVGLTGDIVIVIDKINKKTKDYAYKRITLEKLYNLKIKGKRNVGKRTRCMIENGFIGSNELLDIFENGVDVVYKITTKKGYNIKVNKDCLLLSNSGWRIVGDLKISNLITLNGVRLTPEEYERLVKLKREEKLKNPRDYYRLKKIFFDEIVSIEEYGKDIIFNLKMENGYSNFIANGFVIHSV